MDPVDERQNPAYRWFVCAILALCLAFSYMDRTVFTLLIVPIEADFGLSDTEISLVAGSSFGLCYSIFGFPLARIADAWHRRNLIVIGVVIWCLGTIGCGLALGAGTLFLARISVAMGEAVLMPSAVSIIADYFPTDNRTRALNTYSIGIHIGGGLSLTLGGLILHSVGVSGISIPPLGQFAGWRAVFMILGLAGFCLVPLLLSVREPRRVDRRGSSDQGKLSLSELLQAFAENRRAIMCTIGGFGLLAMAAQSVQGWKPTLFVRVHGWSPSEAGLRIGMVVLVMGPLGAIVGSLLADGLARRGITSSKLLVGILTALASAGAAMLITLQGVLVAFAGVIALQFLVSFNFGLVQAALTDILPNRARGVGTAAYVASSNLLTALIGPFAIGAITDSVFHDPLAVALSIRIVAPCSFLLAAIVLWWGLRPYREAISKHAPTGLGQAVVATTAP